MRIHYFRPKDIDGIIERAKRPGHPSLEDIRKMAKETIVDNLNLGQHPENRRARIRQVCEAWQTLRDINDAE